MPKIMFTNPHSDKRFAVWVEPWAASRTEVAVQDRSGTELECGHQRPMER
ncbi:hypothetical protein AB0N05_15915 [Nocardia sp. NPDC051030]